MSAMGFGRIQITTGINSISYDCPRKFFEWLHQTLGHKSMDDWYDVTRREIYENGGAGMLTSYYNNSPSKALQNVYPEHNWLPTRFDKDPHTFIGRLLSSPMVNH